MKYKMGRVQKETKKATIDLKITTIDTLKAQDQAFEKVKNEALKKKYN